MTDQAPEQQADQQNPNDDPQVNDAPLGESADTDPWGDPTDAQPSGVKVPNVTAGAKSGLAHEVIGSAQTDAIASQADGHDETPDAFGDDRATPDAQTPPDAAQDGPQAATSGTDGGTPADDGNGAQIAESHMTAQTGDATNAPSSGTESGGQAPPA